GRSTCSTARGVSPTPALSLKSHLFRQRHRVVFIGFPRYFRSFFEVECRRRRSGTPLQPSSLPRIVRSRFPITQGPQQINNWQEIANCQNAGACRREHVIDLIFRRILPVTARHPEVSHDELREEGQVEADENDNRGKPAPAFGIHAPGYFGPPEMHSSQISQDGASHHHVMEVGNYEVCVVNVYVDSQASEE